MADTEELGLEVFVEGWQRFEQILDRLDRDVDKTGQSMSKTGGIAGGVFASALGNIAANAVTALGNVLVDAGHALVNFGVDAVQTAISYESAFAGVTKTTDGLTDEFGDLTEEGQAVRDGLKEISEQTPISFEQLSGIAELGGQLGIQRENLLDFTQVIADLGATTNLTEEKAATSFAQIANIMGASQGDFDNMGSSVVALGNNMATTEGDIVNFAQRIAGAGEIAGLTEADVFGIGAAFSSVGIEAEAGGTAVQKVLLGINESVVTGDDNLNVFAQTAGMTAGEFGAAWEQDAGAVFTRFVEGLGTAGDDAISILGDLGLQDQRLIRSFLSLSGAGDLLSDSIALSSTAWDENNALSNEAAQRYATTESQIEMFKNQLKNTGDTIGGIFLPIVTDMLGTFKTLIDEHGPELQAIFETVAKVVKRVVKAIMDFASGEVSVEDIMPPEIMDIFNRLSAWWNEYGPGIKEAASTLFEKFKESGQELADNVIPFVLETVDKLVTWFEENGPLIQDFIATIAERWGLISEKVADFWEVVEPILAGLIEQITNIATLVMEVFTGDWEAAWETLKTIVSDAWETIKETFVAFADFVLGFLGETWEGFVETWRSNWEMFKEIIALAWDAIQQKASEIWDAIVAFVTEKLNALLEFLGLNTDEMKTRWQTIMDDISAIAEEIWARIEEFVSEKAEAIKTFVDEKMTALKDALGPIWDTISEKVSEIWDTIKTAVETKGKDVYDTATGIIRDIQDWIAGKVSDFVSIGSDLINGIKEGVRNAAQGLVDAATSVIESAISAAKSALQIGSPSRVFLDIGANTMQSMAAGIKALAPQVQAAFSAAVTPPSRNVAATAAPGTQIVNNITNTDARQFNLNTNTTMQPGQLAMEFNTFSLASR